MSFTPFKVLGILGHYWYTLARLSLDYFNQIMDWDLLFSMSSITWHHSIWRNMLINSLTAKRPPVPSMHMKVDGRLKTCTICLAGDYNKTFSSIPIPLIFETNWGQFFFHHISSVCHCAAYVFKISFDHISYIGLFGIHHKI